MSSKTKPQTKSAKVITLLSRTIGATLDEICKATNWQQHSIRAFLTGLRKKGYVLAREQRGDDSTAYRITQSPSDTDAKRSA
ncbi:DUF3489 domain-containing protein [Parasphingorhabdus cellanae]|uniref:DUF3489 domain-containing protein n=1 Tax=Parasphingorhabdus cellanae TaxID=2806553 RepID=A0ABX7T5V7_9SPHN|nr:DUF3489 domain-containing protein [Parasphingorhabdus cellanae]QTD56911.1 DUF3489 domain-containing protein [Parasphingorhabdus cellanae]